MKDKLNAWTRSLPRWVANPIIYVVWITILTGYLIFTPFGLVYMIVRDTGQGIWFRYIRPWLKKRLDD